MNRLIAFINLITYMLNGCYHCGNEMNRLIDPPTYSGNKFIMGIQHG